MTAPRVSQHFRLRVSERVSPDVCPDLLGRELLKAIVNEREDLVRFVCKGRKGVRVYRFHVSGVGDRFAVVNPVTNTMVSVLLPGFAVVRAGKRRKKVLREARL